MTALITGDGTYGLRISDSVGGADYSSKEGTNAPKLLVSVGGATPQSCTITATATPTATPSPTPTNTLIPTATFTPGSTPIFSNAAFTYDGGGKRVKSVITTNVGTTTTYFVGTHYEVADGVVTKYYYAGSQRIALRVNGTLNFLLGDHLGSTSLTTDASGQIISELRYKAWGEVRHSSGNTATKYQYTGQYSYAGEFGLHYYNARWYDSSLGRFAQADTIVPGAGNPEAWDRYSYVTNNPLRYTDPSGHMMCVACEGGGGSTPLPPLPDDDYCETHPGACGGGGGSGGGGGNGDDSCSASWPWYCDDQPSAPDPFDGVASDSGVSSDTWCGGAWCPGDIFLYRWDTETTDAYLFSYSYALGFGTWFFTAGGFDIVWTSQGGVMFIEEPVYLDPTRPGLPFSSSDHNFYLSALFGESLVIGDITSAHIRTDPSAQGIREAWGGLAMQEGGSYGPIILNASSSADSTGNPNFQTTSSMYGVSLGIPEVHQYLTNAVPYFDW